MANANIWVINTADSPINAGLENRGWYRLHYDGVTGLVGSSDNYLVGSNAGYEYRNYFSFDLSAIDLSGQQIISATLELTRHANSGTFPVTLGLFDVSTDALSLNSRSGFSNSVFNDLGSGVSYGSYSMVTRPQSYVDVFALNAAAMSGISNAVGGWFSIGGALDLTGRPVAIQSHNLYGSSQGNGGVQRLIIETAPLSEVPEPSTALAFAGILLCGAGLRRTRSSS